MKDADASEDRNMRRASTIAMLLAAALAAHGTCFAQAPAAAASGVEAQRATEASAAATTETETTPTDESRSAFGKVIDVMIGALQRQSRDRARPARPVRTTAAGTPTDIEVGAAFRDALSGSGEGARDIDAIRAGTRQTGTGGAAAATTPRAAPPEDLAVRQAALAGPG
jgi:hypothetical protein